MPRIWCQGWSRSLVLLLPKAHSACSILSVVPQAGRSARQLKKAYIIGALRQPHKAWIPPHLFHHLCCTRHPMGIKQLRSTPISARNDPQIIAPGVSRSFVHTAVDS
jgi:hypothetical protein